MNMKVWWSLAIILFVVIVALAAALFFIPTPVHAPTAENGTPTSTASTEPAATSTAPLHTKVLVTSPAPGATIGHTLTLSGEAPGNWYFEASFPVKVTTPQGDTIGAGQARAQSDWMTTAQVPFTATIDLDMAYSGPATVALLRDNPSGLPENDDSLSFPVIVQ
jgi:hypothetical protein